MKFKSYTKKGMEKEQKKGTKAKTSMQNITINLPECYDDNIQKLIQMKIIPSRSEAVRTALREFLQREYNNLKLLGYFDTQDTKSNPGQKPKSTKKSRKMEE